MSQDEQQRAIRSLASDGFGDHEIARLCGLHVEMVRRVLARDEAAAVACASVERTMSDRWPAYELFLKSATTLAEHSDIPRGNAGAGLFAVAVTILAKEWGNAKLAEWLHAQADSIGKYSQ